MSSEYRKFSDTAGNAACLCSSGVCRDPDPVTGDSRTGYGISGVSLLSEADPFAYPLGRSSENEG